MHKNVCHEQNVYYVFPLCCIAESRFCWVIKTRIKKNGIMILLHKNAQQNHDSVLSTKTKKVPMCKEGRGWKGKEGKENEWIKKGKKGEENEEKEGGER